MTLTDFLLARIAEQERAAHILAERDRRPLLAESPAVDHPAFILADLAAKRRIVEDCADAWEQRRPSGTPTEWGHHAWGGLEHACRLLALPYADHPDFDDSWRH